MSRRYDSRTTIFSPEGLPLCLVSSLFEVVLICFLLQGRLYQVEYAMEAISHAGTALGILATDGIVIAAEKKTTSKLLEQTKTSEKIYPLSEFVVLFFLCFLYEV
eukprot:Partr_v1_DN26529_c2_g1_i4_m4051 putative The proteasome is a multicatalytic proteinase complex which is characterized by its ability to cleave peptides with Arg, Phe, Tyr, Leu, and Glu adjacent to the leaving group at neutral or slightly basic pH. The proteasome has an ATP-dependent proteolytic activity (By similarity)